jgi:hypothetical protein
MSTHLPTWDDINDLVEAGRTLDPLEQFIYDNEPCDLSEGDDGKLVEDEETPRLWREQLQKLIEFL